MPEFLHEGKLYYNPVEFAMDNIGGTWKMPILWRLKDRILRYSELKKALPKITHKMLSSQLRELEERGFILTLTVQRDNSLIISEIRNWCLSFVVATFFIKGFIFATLCLSLRYVY